MTKTPSQTIYQKILLYLSLRELRTTQTEEKLIAAEAIIGESVIANRGKSAPAATGMQIAL